MGRRILSRCWGWLALVLVLSSCDACDIPCGNTYCDPATQACDLDAGVCICEATTCPGGACVDLTSDPYNCGACGAVCSTSDPNANANCSGGACNVTCEVDYVERGGQCVCALTTCGGACVDLQTDSNNCGACGSVCSTSDPDATATCSVGACNVSCDDDYVKSGGQCVCALTACGSECVDTQTDTANCGGCGSLCDAALNATASCDMGVCTQLCEEGWGNCGSPGACEINFTEDPRNCGNCGTVCGSGQCASGQCVCGRFGGACLADSDCCSGQCTDGQCGCKLVGSGCQTGSACCSQTCGPSDGGLACVCAGPGGSCYTATDCCSGTCASGTCQ